MVRSVGVFIILGLLAFRTFLDILVLIASPEFVIHNSYIYQQYGVMEG